MTSPSPTSVLIPHHNAPVSVVTDRDMGIANGMSMDGLIDHAGEIDRQYTYHQVSTKCVARVSEDKISIGDDNLELTARGWSQLANACKAPADYWGQLPSELRAQNAQYHLDNQSASPGTNRKRCSVEAVANQNRFVGFRSIHLIHLEFTDVLSAIDDVLGEARDSYSVNKLFVSDDSISVELTTPRMTHAVQVGDDVQGGIAVSHSILGNHSTTIDLFVLRLLCQNGLALRHCVGHATITRSRRLKDNGAQSRSAAKDQIQRMVVERLKHQTSLFGSLSQLPDAQIARAAGTDDEEAIRRFLMPSLRATHLWSDQLWRRVLAPAWRHVHGGNGELNEFAAVNTITYVATHQRDLTFRQRRTLARLAGLLSFRRVHVCPNCNRTVLGN
ncbi:MAG TPA: hypothetical protein PLY87_02325 [Planctomycetaceae bacterium]|nr:hypothetical protein [Planctomycetaceae bacterium]HQZ63878.1 hypothetical protein [Planctomycetaceae bacterium]